MNVVSVIVPVYNVEKYLNRCIESLINQTYKNIEVLLIDDGSTDTSGLICNEFAEIDKRIKVFHKKNGGLSDARNFGIKKAMGKYLTFVDSDDYVDKLYIEILLKEILKKNADIAISNYKCVYDAYQINKKSNYNTLMFDKNAAFGALFDSHYKYQFTMATGKLYKASIFNKVYFPVARNYEDTATAHLFINESNNIVYIDRVQYFYFIRDDSITNKVDYFKNDMILAVEDQLSFFIAYGNELFISKSAYSFFSTLIGMYVRIPIDNAKCNERKNYILLRIKKELIIINKKKLNLFFLIRIRIFLMFPNLYTFIFKIIRKG